MQENDTKPAAASLTMWATAALIALEGAPIIYLWGAGGLVLGAVLPNVVAIILALVIIFGRVRATRAIKGLFSSGDKQ